MSLSTGCTNPEDELRGLGKDHELAGTAWLDSLLPLVGKPEGQALDLGCGAEADLVRLAQEGWKPMGRDREPRAAKLTQELYGFPVVEAACDKPLPVGDNSFTLITSRFALHLLPPADAATLFREVRRVLVLGCRFIFAIATNIVGWACRTTTPGRWSRSQGNASCRL